MGRLHRLSEAIAQGLYILHFSCCVDVIRGLYFKTFQSYMQFKEIPRKLIVAKRLAQCLNPALPTGVHQRALDVYAHILAVSGVRPRLCRLSFTTLSLEPSLRA